MVEREEQGTDTNAGERQLSGSMHHEVQRSLRHRVIRQTVPLTTPMKPQAANLGSLLQDGKWPLQLGGETPGCPLATPHQLMFAGLSSLGAVKPQLCQASERGQAHVTKQRTAVFSCDRGLSNQEDRCFRHGCHSWPLLCCVCRPFNRPCGLFVHTSAAWALRCACEPRLTPRDPSLEPPAERPPLVCAPSLLDLRVVQREIPR